MPSKILLPELEICNKYKNGKMVKDLAIEYNCSTGPIEKLLRKYNCRKRGVWPEEEIIEKYQNGSSARQIANNMGCSQHTVLEILKKNNITTRPAHKIKAKFTGPTLEQRRVYKKRYLEKHRERLSIIERHRRKNDTNYALKKNLRCRIYQALKGINKVYNTAKLLDCSLEEFRAHLEQQFQDGMTWGNYGEWHIDHIKPCASFNLVEPAQQKECFHYSNLQPLWAKENLSKGSRYGH